MSKIRTSDLKVVQEVPTDAHPISTYEPTRKVVWVACYGGSILGYDDATSPSPPDSTGMPSVPVGSPHTAHRGRPP
jgi:hypothetical protein